MKPDGQYKMEKNELNKAAKGGTELMQERLHNRLDQNLLKQFQIIPSRVREIDEDRKTIYWLHDLHGDPEVQHLKDGGWQKFDKLVFVSHWQQQMYNAYLGVPYSAGTVLKNAIDPIEEHEKPDDKIRLIYHSTPHRGLDILYAAFNQLSKEHDNLELNVFSSFELYGWPQRDQPYKELFDMLRGHPHINYHKSVSNERIREELKKAHIFAYPSTWQETSCLCLIEAMSAGLTCVHPSLAALPETASNLTVMYDYHEDPQAHANRFYSYLKHVIQMYENTNQRKGLEPQLETQKNLADSFYGWRNRQIQWHNLFKMMLSEEK